MQRLQAACLYLVCDDRPDAFLHAALSGGVDIVQLRMKGRDDDAIVAAGRRFAKVCAEHQALLILNDRPDLVADARADGVHVGQDDVAVWEARATVGPDRIVGLSTHTPAQIERAEADYVGVGPVFATPTKPGRAAVGLELVRYAAAHAQLPWFAIGGIDTANVEAVRAAGAERIAVVRAIGQAPDPERAAHALRAGVTGRQRVGATQP